MIKKVLVVGGAGYIGGGVTDELVRRNIPFAVFDNLTYETHYLKPVEFIYGDIRDTEALKKILPEFSHVIWLAALVGDPVCEIEPGLAKQINQDSVEWLAKNYSGRILFTSTCSVYGVSKHLVSEDSELRPLSVYAKTKLRAEAFLKDKDCLIFRLGTAYGVSDTHSRIRMDLAVNYMTMKALKFGFLEVFGGAQWRPFIHVYDIARFLVDSLDTKATGVYNLATENLQISDLAKKIQTVTGCEIKLTEGKFQDDRNYHADVAKAKKDKILPVAGFLEVVYGARQIQKLAVERRINDMENSIYSNAKHMVKILNDYLGNAINK